MAYISFNYRASHIVAFCRKQFNDIISNQHQGIMQYYYIVSFFFATVLILHIPYYDILYKTKKHPHSCKCLNSHYLLFTYQNSLYRVRLYQPCANIVPRDFHFILLSNYVLQCLYRFMPLDWNLEFRQFPLNEKRETAFMPLSCHPSHKEQKNCIDAFKCSQVLT